MVDKDDDIADIAEVLKRDAVLSYKLISLANSAAMGLSVEVTSIQHAVSMLGMSRLKHWLSVLMIHCGGNDTPPALMHAAFTRAAFLEAVGKSLDIDGGNDELFLCGAFSLLDKILGLPIEKILEKVSVSEAITDALLTRTGPYAELLTLAEAVEKRDDAALRKAIDDLALYPQVVNRALLGAIRTAGQLTAS
jgi:EAL and modified HD-GYP domain-containing signal transduction protein